MIKEKLSFTLHKPGCYLMKDKDGIIIYVGKAKDLRNRLSSYFNGKHIGKTAMLVKDIADFEYMLVDNELESLVLEINLIKKHKPKYNIMFMDDKSYPYILITEEKFPRVIRIRKTNEKNVKGKAYGPYPDAYAARRVVDLLNRLYPLRKCKIMPKKKCLYYHIGQCLGYCEEKIDSDVINKMIEKIAKFLNGNYDEVKKDLVLKMNKSSDAFNYELAKEYRDDIEYIDKVLDKQKVEEKSNVDRDVFNFYVNNGYMCIYVLHIRKGKLLGNTKNIFPMIDEVDEEYLGYVSTFYENRIKPKEIFVNDRIDTILLSDLLNVKVLTPQKGEKKKLLLLAFENAKNHLNENFELISKDEGRTLGAMNELSDLVGIDVDRIEAFDNSNLFGSFSVSGMVVFENGKPLKKEYRKYKISIDKNDDYNMIKEVIYRRYYKVMFENLKKPDIIIVDGGITQINAARETLTDLGLNILVLGLSKNDKHKTSELLGFDPVRKIEIDKKSNLFYLLNRIQDEVHRWTINYHRQIRSKGNIESVLDNVKGIGPKRRKELIKKYGSIKKIKEASIDDLQDILSEEIANNLKKYLKDSGDLNDS